MNSMDRIFLKPTCNTTISSSRSTKDYTVPIKALVSEKSLSFSHVLGPQSVGMIIGDGPSVGTHQFL
jgi:replicative superfamily II helicase